MTVREWAEYWQETYDAPAVRRTTYEAHRYVLENHIIPCFGKWELTELTSDMVGGIPGRAQNPWKSQERRAAF